LFSFSQKCKLSTGAVQGVRRPSRSLRVCNLRKLLKDCCRKECTESKRFKYLEVFEEVAARSACRSLLEDLSFFKKAQEG
jgi:hypothetical protein